ncbi:hypothetical protein CFP56_002335 [Quercus suber]|uniref:Secreted protein n=1 Tax=Quercus suber TaxID=58331 RepID=A0AAW0ILP7_QUESU
MACSFLPSLLVIATLIALGLPQSESLTLLMCYSLRSAMYVMEVRSAMYVMEVRNRKQRKRENRES